ncbi:alpha/Beta hydrolase fold protein [Artemisia annua]|uniref:Alpha/Beta hydrolase fold protein n=1 Tax=Artemisia annua TaxID=35608 RepID=A0A2U1LDR6_ARTAN|nr:alpha/Beta hydrolase fold protein [Artemisia annua]
MATFKLNLSFNTQLHKQPLINTSSPNKLYSRFPKTIRLSPVTCVASTTSKPISKTSSLHEKLSKKAGRDNSSCLLDQMDSLLRSELIRYGEMAQACYDAFESNPYSKTFFQDLGMNDSGYMITSYIYSSNTSNLIPKFFTKTVHSDGPWNPMVNWMGYVAVSDDETTAQLGRRDITIAWRGTVTKLEWMEDLMNFLKPVSAQNLISQDPSIKVMAGFLHIYTDKDQRCPYSKFSAREQLLAEVARLTKIYKQKGEEMSITITGHSLGSALSILSAYDIAESELDVLDDNINKIPISVLSFSGPRVGNTRFRKRVEELGIKVLRVFNIHDRVPNVPGILFHEYTPAMIQRIADWTTMFYSHIGQELALDHTRSSFVKKKLDMVSTHNLELLLHLIDGYHGKGGKFWLATGRDKALVNKHGDILKHEYLIPPNWSQVENKGLRRNQNGEWMLPEEESIEDHLRPEDVDRHLKNLGLV